MDTAKTLGYYFYHLVTFNGRGYAMARIGILAEKPSQARAWAEALGGRQGRLPDGDEYTVCNARGHLLQDEPPERNVNAALAARYKSWDPASLPWDPADLAWRKTPGDHDAPLLASIRKTLSACDEIVIATDNDPTGEGDLLAWEILDETGLAGKRVSRTHAVDETPVSLRTALAGRTPITDRARDGAYVQAVYRQRWDYLSLQFTRAATAAGGTLLKQGRLKSFIVTLVGDQQTAHDQWERKPYYVRAWRDEHGWQYECDDATRYDNPGQVPDDQRVFPVHVGEPKRQRLAPPRLPDLAALASRLSKAGHASQQVLDTYQAMYEAGVVSYPRTEDATITREQYRQLLDAKPRLARLMGIDPTLLDHDEPRGTHVKDQGSHGANRPGPNIPDSLTGLEQYGKAGPAIYRELALATLAMFAPDAVRQTTIATLDGNPGYQATRVETLVPGWRAILGRKEETPPPFGTSAQPAIVEHVPERPAEPSMGWLMKQLAKHDVGTGATRTGTYSDMQRNPHALIADHKGRITLTDDGKLSYQVTRGTHIAALDTTETVHQTMRRLNEHPDLALVDGLLDPVARLVTDDLATMQANRQRLLADGTITVKPHKERETFTVTRDGRDWNVNRVWNGHRFTDEETSQLAAGQAITFPITAPDGQPLDVTGQLAIQTYKNHQYLGFQQEQGDGIPAIWCRHRFTPRERELLENGRAIYASDFIGKNGRKFSCTLSWNAQENKFTPVFPARDTGGKTKGHGTRGSTGRTR